MNEYIQALPGILFWVVLFVVIKSVRAKRDEESMHPKNAAQRELVDDVIATIERTAPDFDGAAVYHSSSKERSASGSYGGHIAFQSLCGGRFEYNFESHGYSVSREMALTLAAAIAKRFGSEYRPITRLYMTVIILPSDTLLSALASLPRSGKSSAAKTA